MNLLYKQGQYDQVVELYEDFRKRDLSGRQFPKDIVVLLTASYYKIVSATLQIVTIYFD